MSEEAPPPVLFNAPFECQIALGQAPTTTAGSNITFDILRLGAYANHTFANLLTSLPPGNDNGITMEVKKISVYGTGSGYLQVVPYAIQPADLQKYPVGSNANKSQLAISTMTSTVDRKPQWHWDIPESAYRTRVYNIAAPSTDDRLHDIICTVKYLVPQGVATFDFVLIIADLVFRRQLNVIPAPLMIEDVIASSKAAKPDEQLKKLVAKREHEDEQYHKIKRIKELTMPNVH